MTEDEMARLAKHIVNEQGPLAGVTPGTAKERLSNLIRHDHEWRAKVSSGETVANQQFRRLVQMVADHQEVTRKAEYETAKAAWDKEQSDREAAKDQVK